MRFSRLFSSSITPKNPLQFNNQNPIKTQPPILYNLAGIQSKQTTIPNTRQIPSDYKPRSTQISTSSSPESRIHLKPFQTHPQNQTQTPQAPQLRNQSYSPQIPQLRQTNQPRTPNQRTNQRELTFNPNFHKPSTFKYEVSLKASRNNTIITFSDAEKGGILYTSTAGTCGLKKANRGTNDAGYRTALQLLKNVSEKIVRPSVHVKLNGFGPGREQAFRGLITGDWQFIRLTDVTPIKFGGCRSKKKRTL